MPPTTAEQPPTAESIYDAIGPAYETAFAGLNPQIASIDWLLDVLNDRNPAKCLDIGCGTGKPVCSSLSAAGHDVTGIDISSAMIEDARKKVPNATFHKLSMFEYQPEDATFDAITVYFSMLADFTPEQIRQSIGKIYEWLRSGGFFVFATVPIAVANMSMEWMGKPVVVSSLDADDAMNCMRQVGFEIIYHATSTFTPKGVEAGICRKEDLWEETHLFVYAKKP